MPDDVQEELTAYLDGELDPAGSRRVEERLKNDPAYRAELQRLEQAWRMLDQLDRAVVGENFTRTTMEMVAVAAADDARRISLAWPKSLILAAAGLIASSGLLGLACGTWIWPDPNRQLLHELPILESIDLYDQGDSIEFLRKLERAGIFDQQPDQAAAPVSLPETSADDEIDERRAEIERMTPLERQHLRRNQERFAKYSLDDQGRMLRLLDDLDRDPHEDELRRVMIRYHEWLDTLALSARAELTDLSPDERIAKIKDLKQQQTTDRDRERQEAPSEQDLQWIVRRVEEFGWQNRQALLGTLSPARQQYIEGLDEAKQRRALLWLAVHQSQTGNKAKLPQWDAQAMGELFAQLSVGAQHRLAALNSEKEKQKLIGTWMQTALRHRVETGGIRQTLPPVEVAELQRFFRDELSSQQREWMLPLARDQRHRLLLRMYFLPPSAWLSCSPASGPAGRRRAQTTPSRARVPSQGQNGSRPRPSIAGPKYSATRITPRPQLPLSPIDLLR